MHAANEALADMACYYYNNEMNSQLAWCSAEADRLAHRTGKYDDGYFVVKFFDCQRDLWDGRYTEAISHAKEFYAKAIRSKNVSGEIRFNELMGLIYQIMGRSHHAYSYMHQALDLQIHYDEHDPGRVTQLLSDLIEIELNLDEYNRSAKHHIDRLCHIQDLVDKENKGRISDFPTERNRRMACAYYAKYYVKTKQNAKAKAYLVKAARMQQSDVYVDFLLDHASALYYRSEKEYSKALRYIDRVIETDDSSTVEYLIERADILAEMGNNIAAQNAFRVALRKQSDNTKNGFDKEVASLQNVYSSMQMKLNLKQAEMERERFERELLTVAAIFLLLAVLALTAFLVYNHKVRKRLQLDKDELHQSDSALKKALLRAEEVNRLKDSFMHNISHEIRTPLNSIVGFSSIIAEEQKDNGEYANYCRIINENNEALLSVINNIVDLAIYQSTNFSTVSMQYEQVDVAAICRKSIEFVKMSGKLKSGVRLSFTADPESLILCTNPKYLNKILLNLLMNAVKYTDNGSISLAYRLVDEGCRVEFSVTDTGMGIKTDSLECIFTSFEKAGSFVQGMGLGLTICRELLTKLGGEIHVDGNYTDGARFVFHLVVKD